MKLTRFFKEVYWKQFSVFPNITIIKDDMLYICPNWKIKFSFLGFHVAWLFQKEDMIRY